MSMTIMFLLHFLLIKRNYAIFYLHNFWADAFQNVTFSFLICLRLMQLMRYAIFIGWMFCIFRVPCEKMGSLNPRNMLFFGQKQQKSENCQKSTYAKNV